MVGSKQLDTIRDEKIEDDRQQMDKLKASLSIQAICSNFAHHEKVWFEQKNYIIWKPFLKYFIVFNPVVDH